MAKLTPPFPSAPSRPPKYSFGFHRGDKLVRLEAFGAAYSALAYIQAVIGDNEIRWRGDDAFHVEDLGITVKGNGLEEVMEYTPTKAEADFVLPEPYASDAASIASGETRRKLAPPKKVSEEEHNESSRKGTKRTPPRAPVPDGFISLAAICADIGMEPRDARAILRKKATKSEHGWAWPTAEAKKIKSMLSGKDEHDGEKDKAARSKSDAPKRGRRARAA